MFLLLQLLLFGIPLVNSDYTMVISWGQPINCWDPITIDTSSWDTCVQLCYLDIYCVLAHGTSEFCLHYHVGKVNGAQKLTSASGSKVALKSTVTSSSNCASGLKSGTSTTVVITDPNVPSLKISYTLTFSKDTWSFAFSVTGVCPDSKWQVFFRPTTMYCIRVYTSTTQYYNQAVATANCASIGATLAGLEANEERLWTVNQVVPVANAVADKATAIWISGDRKPDCLLETDASKPECAGLNAFNFTDKYLTNKSGYQWAPGQPDSYTAGTGMQNCLQLWVTKAQADEKFGLVDDNVCNYTSGRAYFSMRGYACGKIPA